MNGYCYFSEGLNPAVTCNKQYEAGELDISRHDFLEFEVREDGVSNTIDTVQKDNLLAVKPMQMSGYECDEQNGEAHTLNCSDQRKVFGANQTRTMAGEGDRR